MGNALCQSTKDITPEEKSKSSKIDALLRNEKKVLQHEIKLLLLGAGESGKSTIAKQMKVIFMSGYSDEERAPYKEIVHSNVILAMRSLMIALNKINFIDSLSPENKANAQLFLSNDILFEQEVKKEIGAAVKALWTDPELRKKYQATSEFQVHDSAQYYFDQIDRISQEDYLPTVQDVLQSRARTTGITEVQFNVDDVRFRMVDVGGQRSERKKWIHCFEDVTAVIFVAAINEYDQTLYEDNSTNRILEATELFEKTCNSKWFGNANIILFLNKRDLFLEKIKKVDLVCCFPEYKGGLDYDAAADFLMAKFRSMNKQPKVKIYAHITCATDTDNVKFTFNSVKKIVINSSLKKSGLA